MTIKPTDTGEDLPTGWILTTSYPTNKLPGRRTYIYEGPKSSIDDAVAGIKELHEGEIASIAPSASSTSAKASVTVLTAPAVIPPEPGEDPVKIAPDTYTISPSIITVALSAHPIFDGYRDQIRQIDRLIAFGRIDEIIASFNIAPLNTYYNLRFAGVSSWETISYMYTATEHYALASDVSSRAESLSALSGTVVAWSSVIGHDVVGYEPKWKNKTGNAQSFEWRQNGIAVNYTSTECQLSVSYTAAWKWASALYNGGSWNPQ